MSAISCIGSWAPALSKGSRKLFASGIQWSAQQRPSLSRGVNTAAPTEELILREEEDADDPSAEEERIRKIRDISGLRPEHRNVANRTVPSEEPFMPWHFTVLHNKRMFGRYGYASGVNPALCWPTKAQLKDRKEYENIAYPYNIMEVADRERAKQEKEEKERFDRDAQIAENVKKMIQMKNEFVQKQAKQTADAEAAKAFKMRLIEEVRIHFNYTINERDERFKLELKERAKQLKEREKLVKKGSKKEKMALDKVAKFEESKRRLKEEEEKKAASKSAGSQEESS